MSTPPDREYFFVTWVTHNSRVSERMVHYKVERPDNSIWLSVPEEITVTKIIRNIVRENSYEVFAYNICGDHVHIVIRCKAGKLPRIINNLKGISSFRYNKGVTPPLVERAIESLPVDPIYADGTIQKLWAQKYHAKQIETEDQLFRAVEYTQYNREKHELPRSPVLEAVIAEFVQPFPFV